MRISLITFICISLILFAAPLFGADPRLRVLPVGELPKDARLAPLKDLNGYFPFSPPTSKDEWATRSDFVRRRILVSQGLWPQPTKSSLNAVIHGRIERPGYTIEKVYFESAPGFFVTGNLYRPTNPRGKVPGVLFAHGHWRDARLSLDSDEIVKKAIETGQERFEHGGRSIFQSMCVQLARMGCVVWQWDMLGESDSLQLSHDLIHSFNSQRPEMNTTENWGLFSAQAEAHLQSPMGLQTWNSIRSLDFLLSLPEVDPERVAMTGASGGGTQTMLLAAIDPRVKLAFPAVMVSTAMQGGCTCENASLLRVGTGNVEFAALFAPKPLGMTCANDWTKEMSTKGFPELKSLYAFLGAPDSVMLSRGEQFPHNYNAVSRAAFFGWINRHFKLGMNEPILEQDYEPLTREQLAVWDKEHPAPKANDADFERRLLKWFADDAAKQLEALKDRPEELRKDLGAACEVLIGRTFAAAGAVEWQSGDKHDRGSYFEIPGLLRNTTYNEELPVVWLYPKKWNGRVIVWLDDTGKSALWGSDGRLKPAVNELLQGGATVLGADVVYQGEFLKDGEAVKQTRVVAKSRECGAFTFGYNDSLFAQRVHDVLTLVKFLRTAKIEDYPTPSLIGVAGFGGMGPVVVAGRAVAGDSIDCTAADTNGFRFGKLLDMRDPSFLPGGAKYLDLPGFIAAEPSHMLWLTESAHASGAAFGHSDGTTQPTYFEGAASEKELAAAKWLLN